MHRYKTGDSHFLTFLPLSEHWVAQFSQDRSLQFIVDNERFLRGVNINAASLHFPARRFMTTKTDSYRRESLHIQIQVEIPVTAQTMWANSVFGSDIYTIICLKSVCLSTFAQCSSQLWLNRVGRCLKLTASTRGTFCYEFASQFGLDIL